VVALLRPSPIDAQHVCKGCKRYTGLHNKAGELVGHELHFAEPTEQATCPGGGVSGLGLYLVSKGWRCRRDAVIRKENP